MNKAWILVLAYMSLIFYLSSIPLHFPEVINKFDPSKFTLHTIEYSILGFLVFYASKKRNFSIIFSSFYGLSDEIHQYFVPFRYFDWFDLLADVIGSILGVIAIIHFEKMFSKRFKLFFKF